MLQINDLIFKWPNSIQQEVNLEAWAGEIVLIGGPSGIGKTTLFNIIWILRTSFWCSDL